MLSDASHELHSSDARGLPSSFSTGLPGDMEFYD